MPSEQRSKTRVAALSVLSNLSLIIMKIVVGLISGSVSIMSEAIHSSVDLIAAIIAFFAVRTSGKPADVEHPFGHGKVENISGGIEAMLIFVAAGWIIWEAVRKLLHPEPLEQISWGLVVMLISAATNVFVSRQLFRIGKATHSVALEADAWHLRTDVWTSAGVAAGLAIIQAGQWIKPDFNWQWLDPIAAMAVALLIIKAAYDLTLRAIKDLLDVSLNPDEVAWIREVIQAYCPPVFGYHRLRTRKSGTTRFIEFHILVNGDMSVHDSHELTNAISRRIQHHYPDASVTIHIEPCNGYCSNVCQAGCLLPGEERDRRHNDYLRTEKERAHL